MKKAFFVLCSLFFVGALASGQLPTTVGKPLMVNVQDYGAIPDDGNSDSTAIAAAVATGKSVFFPKGTYRLTTAITLSATAGQMIVGAGNGETLITTDAGVNGFLFNARHQAIRDLKIAGTGSGTGGKGIVVPSYTPFWQVHNVFFSALATGLENKTVAPGMGDPEGVDGGRISNSYFDSCAIGYLANGGQDFTVVSGTSFGVCDIGIKVDAGGGVVVIGGVCGGNGTSVLVEEGLASIKAVHFEGSTDYDVDVGTNSVASIDTCAFLASTVNARAAANARVDFLGYNSATSARANGSGKIRSFGGVMGNITIDFNGSFSFPAGDYDYASTGDGLPTAAAGYVGVNFALVSSTSFDLYRCVQTGGASYAWRKYAGINAQLVGDVVLDKTITAGGTTGAQTINKTSGSVNFAATDTSKVVTNSLVTTSSVIIATVATNDGTMKSVQCVAGSGSFTIYANAAATAETRVNWIVTN